MPSTPKKGLLKGKKAAVFVTAGAPWYLYKGFEQSIAGRLTKTYTLWFCGIKSKEFSICKAYKLDDKQKVNIKKKVDKGLRWLFK